MNQQAPRGEERGGFQVEHLRRLGIPALAIAFIFLFSSLIQTVLVAAVSSVAPQITDEGWFSWAASLIPMYAVAMPFSMLLFRSVPGQAPQKGTLSAKGFLGATCLCFALVFAGNWIGSLVNFVIGALRGEPPVNQNAAMALESPLWANLLFGGILAPVMEEVFYRKAVLDRLRVYGDLPALLISSLVFGLIHGNFYQFFYAALSGFVLGYLYLRTGKLRYSIGVHMAVNLVGSVYTAEMLKRIDPNVVLADLAGAFSADPVGALMLLGYELLIPVTCIGAIVTLWRMRGRVTLARGEISMTSKDWRGAILLNPGVWLLAFVILLLFLA
jgi:membrane protease YdiL (CAAX protease family)